MSPVKYLCLIYNEEQKLDAMSKEEWDALAAECRAHDDALDRSGHVLARERLASVHTGTTIRIRDGKVSITDGPYTETKEQLAGFYLVEARDLNDAIRIASKIPPARLGCVEVRPIWRQED